MNEEDKIEIVFVHNDIPYRWSWSKESWAKWIHSMINYQKNNSEGSVFTLFITELEDIEILKTYSFLENSGIVILNIRQSQSCEGCFDVDVMVENTTQLYLLGRYVGCDRKRIYDKDF